MKSNIEMPAFCGARELVAELIDGSTLDYSLHVSLRKVRSLSQSFADQFFAELLRHGVSRVMFTAGSDELLDKFLSAHRRLNAKFSVEWRS